jgi:LPXTG-motif cell wall-anchored protein
MKRSTRSLVALGALTLTGVMFAPAAHAGNITYYRECAPDGQTIVYLTAQNGYLTVYIDGIEGHTLVTGPGTHTVEWWGYPTSDGVRVDGPAVLWDRKTITIDPSNCQAPTTTTAAPTTSEAPTESTALVPPSTIATITPQIDMDVDPCVTSTGCTTVAVGVPPTLPATGRNDGELLLTGGSLILAGSLAVLLVRRTRRVTS